MSEFETDENTEGTVEAEATEDKSQEGSEAKPSMNREVIQNIRLRSQSRLAEHLSKSVI